MKLKFSCREAGIIPINDGPKARPTSMKPMMEGRRIYRTAFPANRATNTATPTVSNTGIDSPSNADSGSRFIYPLSSELDRAGEVLEFLNCQHDAGILENVILYQANLPNQIVGL